MELATSAFNGVRAINALLAAGMVSREQCSMRYVREVNDVNAMCENYVYDSSFRRRIHQWRRRRFATAATASLRRSSARRGRVGRAKRRAKLPARAGCRWSTARRDPQGNVKP